MFRVERELRNAFEPAITAGAFSAEIPGVIVSDRIPEIICQHLNLAEDFAAMHLPKRKREIA